ncbi:MAG: PaaI family thioesterase [Candidatus Protistobacter heckmanni]|nr:PaaI family thioesterase [Candidatus Protistobacter heckmanni]
MGCAVHSTLKPGQIYTTIEMKTVFVRPAFEHTGRLRAEAKLVHACSCVASSEGRIVDAKGKLIAYGSESCLIMDAPGAPKAA